MRLLIMVVDAMTHDEGERRSRCEKPRRSARESGGSGGHDGCRGPHDGRRVLSVAVNRNRCGSCAVDGCRSRRRRINVDATKSFSGV